VEALTQPTDAPVIIITTSTSICGLPLDSRTEDALKQAQGPHGVAKNKVATVYFSLSIVCRDDDIACARADVCITASTETLKFVMIASASSHSTYSGAGSVLNMS